MRKFAPLLRAVAAFVLTPSIGYVCASNATSQQAIPASTQSAPSDAKQTAPVGSRKAQNADQKETSAPGVGRTSRRISNKVGPYSRTIPITGQYPPKVQPYREHSKSEIGVNVAGAADSIAGETASCRTSAVLPRAGTGISGGHLVNGRNEGTPAALGGPANPGTKTGVINGSAMNRKHLD